MADAGRPAAGRPPAAAGTGEPRRSRAGSHGRHAQPGRLHAPGLRAALLAGQPRRLRPRPRSRTRSATATARRPSPRTACWPGGWWRRASRWSRVYSFGNRDWDTHGGNFPALKNTLLPPTDRGLSALLEDLDSRGLAGRNAGRLDGRHGPHAAHQQRRGPRPLVVLLFGRAGRRRRPRRPGVRLLRPQRGVPVHQPGRAPPTWPRPSTTAWASTRGLTSTDQQGRPLAIAAGSPLHSLLV